jgi:predicted glycoside hydrolase/deacetylase ChbG (UPF0249 family)
MAPTLGKRLGFSDGERVAVVHCDDIGMCHAANVGAFEALANGPATCGSIMVPCPWFREAAQRARADSDLDLGVHLTLNSEWPDYRWGPVVGASAVPSLVDAQGCLPPTLMDTVARARPEEVELELRAQVERALEAGIDVTHLDSHMGTVLVPSLVEVYARLAREFRLPVFAVRPDRETLERRGLGGAEAVFEKLCTTLEAEGIPIFDGFCDDSLDFALGQGTSHNETRLDRLGAGINYLICHPARAGDELSAITRDAHARDFERSFYGGDAGRRALASRGIRVLGMRPLRDLVRERA